MVVVEVEVEVVVVVVVEGVEAAVARTGVGRVVEHRRRRLVLRDQRGEDRRQHPLEIEEALGERRRRHLCTRGSWRR